MWVTRSRGGCFRPLAVGQMRPRGWGLGSEGVISTAHQGNTQKEMGFWDYGLHDEGKQAPCRFTEHPPPQETQAQLPALECVCQLAVKQ